MATKNLYEEVRDMRQRALATFAHIKESQRQLEEAAVKIDTLHGQLCALEEAAWHKCESENNE